MGWVFKVKLTTAETFKPPGYLVGNVKGRGCETVGVSEGCRQ